MPGGRGPLHGVTVLEVGGLGPAPFAGMTLAEMGAEVIRIERHGSAPLFPGPASSDLLNRGKRSVGLDLKRPEGVATLLRLVETADILVEGYRPGVTERLGIGPLDCHARNPRLVYGRVTGWGQDGPLAERAGHDIDYIAITGALHAIGDEGAPPQIPLNMVGDFGGGATYLVMGVLAALWEVQRTGRGRVVDAAIVDGAAHLLAATHAMVNVGAWVDERGVNLLDGGAPFYAVYETRDGRHMAVGAIEAPFYRQLLGVLGLERLEAVDQHDRSGWATTRRALAEAFAQRTQAEWTELFAPTDACVAPVLSLLDAVDHPHVRDRGTLVRRDGVLQAAPAPRFSEVPPTVGSMPPDRGQHTREVLTEIGLDAEALIAAGVASEPGGVGPGT